MNVAGHSAAAPAATGTEFMLAIYIISLCYNGEIVHTRYPTRIFIDVRTVQSGILLFGQQPHEFGGWRACYQYAGN